jgi:competence protein ComFC
VKWRLWWETFLGLLYPAEAACLVCSGPVYPSSGGKFPLLRECPLCSVCQERLVPLEPPYCLVCGRHLAPSHPQRAHDSGRTLRCPECRRPTSFVFSRSYGAYRDELRDLLHRYKFMREKSLLPLLASFLCTAWDMHLASIPCDFIVPVPIHPVRLRERGFSHVEPLARELSRHARLPLRNALRRDIHLTGFAARRRQERLRALQGVFSCDPAYREELNGRTVLLVDDIYTTGSTAEACARVLREAGAARVYVLTLAR